MSGMSVFQCGMVMWQQGEKSPNINTQVRRNGGGEALLHKKAQRHLFHHKYVADLRAAGLCGSDSCELHCCKEITHSTYTVREERESKLRNPRRQPNPEIS